jgi:protein-S-isoprenylcysteine O-methyltransferase Ste14
MAVSATATATATTTRASAPGRAWHRLVRLHRDVEATPLGGVLLGNVWPAYLFALPLGTRLWGIAQRPWSLSSTDGGAHTQALVLQEIVTTLFLALVVVLFAVRRRSILGRRADWRRGLVALVGTFLLNAVGFLPVASDASTAALLASSGVIVAGTVFTIWSLATLGRCFGIMPEVRGLVTGGPYRWVRHPVYLGELLSGAGILLVKPHPLVLGLYLAFVWLQVWRTVFEERALAAVFPGEYPAYRARVPRLLPGWPVSS